MYFKQKIKENLHRVFGGLIYRIRLSYYWFLLPNKLKRIKKQEVIKVLFVVSEARSWKSESLYLLMRSHPRFQPLVGVSTNQSFPKAKIGMIEYLESKQYNYIDLDCEKEGIKGVNPDLIIYFAPYDSCYSKGHFFNKNLQYVFCGIDYCMHISKSVAHSQHPLFDYCWQFYVEHNDVAIRKKELLGKKARNIKVTGVPMQDILLSDKNNFVDPWKDRTGKKRIIYAPHHSIKGTNGEGVEFATFLDNGEAILEMAKKYSDKITVAFKPHGTLYPKLVKIWGKERADAYYKEWENLPNTQYEDGEYVGLFKYSDAIIHDCASFILEYLYMDKPSMYLVAKSNNIDEMFDYVKGGYDCYEHGHTIEDIESFLNRVIEDKDVKKIQRNYYLREQLLPPGGNSACANIINSILDGLR